MVRSSCVRSVDTSGKTMSEQIKIQLKEKIHEIDSILEGLNDKKKSINEIIKLIEELRQTIYNQLLST